MEKVYNPTDIEAHWSQYWEQQGYGQPQGNGAPYCIMLPPPNVTGTLHMGHGFQHTLMDALIRKHRMEGDQTLWQPGTDHAGIATQIVVERELGKSQLTRHDLGREKFIEKVWEWRKQSGATITQQMRRLGVSVDWSREAFSMDDSVSCATREAFIQLYDEGLIYRGKRLVNWDPTLKTAVSDLEVNSTPEQGHLWHLRYPLTDGSGEVIVATTRPETFLGDTAVAVHPDDERYTAFVGKTITLPLVGREIPIIADDYVDREFGSGCVKITPAHDFNDYEMGLRHDLPMLNILTEDAHLNNEVPATYRGLERFAARKQLVADLKAEGFLAKVEDHTLNVPRGDRSNTIIEPYLTDQWFVNAKVLAEPAIAAVKQGDLQFVPQNWSKTYLQWLENIQDWCISRQLWWGHRIPVWYDADGQAYIGHDEADARARANLTDDVALTQDDDVLDTWFTAALWPFSGLGWPEKTEALQTFYPTSVLVTGFDIIFFWVARMVMIGLKIIGNVPFSTVYITGLIRDAQGQKMSKSKGNIIDPIDLIDGITLDKLVHKRTARLMQPQMAKTIERQTRQEFPDGIPAFGTDALRFTFCALATNGRDINFDLGRISGYRNFCNKIWNAARYVFMHCDNQNLEAAGKMQSIADRWIRSRLQEVIASAQQHFAQYRFDLLATTLYEFIWNDYCDWYLELSKCNMNAATRRTLLEVLETFLRLLHPLMPFITEEIWQKTAKYLNIDGPSIMLQAYPTPDDSARDQTCEAHVAWLQAIITSIRNLRGEMNVSPAKKITLLLTKGTNDDHRRLEASRDYLAHLARVEDMAWHDASQALPPSATAVVDALEIHIPLAGLIDKASEIQRLNKEMAKLKKDLEKSRKKLDNPSYINKAPAEVVAKERERLRQAETTLEKLQAHQQRIEDL